MTALHNLGRSAGLVALLYLFIQWINPTVALVSGEGVPENRLTVVEVTFEDGLFYQKLRPSAGQPVQADWTATISEGPVVICSGSGAGTYRPGEDNRWDADTWTGDDCSDLVPGRAYHAEASWQHDLSGGHIHTLVTEFDFIYSEAPSDGL